MATQIQYLGHASFKIQGDYTSILIDPFFTGNPYACCTPDDFIALDAILVTHGHSDHIGDVEAIAKSTECKIICNAEIADYFKSEGIAESQLEVMAVGETKAFPFGKVTMTKAVHPNAITVDGKNLPAGEPCGFVIEVDGHKIYHAGDTFVFDEMKDLAALAIDVALLPIGGCYTMTADDAVKVIDMIKPREVIPMHYDTFPQIKADPNDFAKKVTGAAVRVLQSSEKEIL